jgi:hypothetical protein
MPPVSGAASDIVDESGVDESTVTLESGVVMRLSSPHAARVRAAARGITKRGIRFIG